MRPIALIGAGGIATGMEYRTLLAVHISCVVLSGSGFVLRGVWMLADAERGKARWVRVLPHVIDTLLLASAIGLALTIHQYPLVHGWLTAKVVGLLAYIVLGSIALKRGRTRAIRTVAFAAALLCFAYIVSVALTKSPLPGVA